MLTLEERFWSKVLKQPGDGCWLWTAATFKSGGYGQLATKKGQAPARAHRVSWVIHFGSIPDGMRVLHTCDTPACVRPDHLFLGTQQDNMTDMAMKGRSPRGILNKQSKLTDEQVDQIKSLQGQLHYKAVAERFGISPNYVHRIWRGGVHARFA